MDNLKHSSNETWYARLMEAEARLAKANADLELISAQSPIPPQMFSGHGMHDQLGNPKRTPITDGWFSTPLMTAEEVERLGYDGYIVESETKDIVLAFHNHMSQTEEVYVKKGRFRIKLQKRKDDKLSGKLIWEDILHLNPGDYFAIEPTIFHEFKGLGVLRLIFHPPLLQIEVKNASSKT